MFSLSAIWKASKDRRSLILERKRQHKDWLDELRQRNKTEFCQKWKAASCPLEEKNLFSLLNEIANIMLLPSSLIYPDDTVSIVLREMSFIGELREVESIMVIEEKCGMNIDPDLLVAELTMGELLGGKACRS